MKYKRVTKQKNILLTLINVLFLYYLHSFSGISNSHLDIKYKVDGDEAHGNYDSILTQAEEDEIMRLFEIEKEKCNQTVISA